jgi:hypothetical protein
VAIAGWKRTDLTVLHAEEAHIAIAWRVCNQNLTLSGQNLLVNGLYDGEFVGFKIASSEELDSALREAVVAVDANLLLDLYRFRPQTSRDLIKTLKSLNDRLVVPHQALREFWRRRQRSQDSPRGATKMATDALEKSDRSIRNTLVAWAQAVGVDHDELSNFTARVDGFVKNLRDELQRVLEDTDAERGMDPILAQLEEILEGRITSPLDQKEWSECIAEANRRIEDKVPPGYMDAGKRDSDLPEGGAGDYLVWYQATRHAKEQGRDLLIVTRDRKEDWWWRQQSDFIGPRPELTLEYHELTGRRLFMLRPADLLTRASVLEVEVDRESPADAGRVADIDRYSYVDIQRYPYVEDDTGRRYSRIDLTTGGPGNHRLSYEWRGVRLPEGRRWRHSKAKLDRMYAEGRIEFLKNRMPVGKRYLDEQSSPSTQTELRLTFP